jgi:hypothetical protein
MSISYSSNRDDTNSDNLQNRSVTEEPQVNASVISALVDLLLDLSLREPAAGGAS